MEAQILDIAPTSHRVRRDIVEVESSVDSHLIANPVFRRLAANAVACLAGDEEAGILDVASDEAPYEAVGSGPLVQRNLIVEHDRVDELATIGGNRVPRYAFARSRNFAQEEAHPEDGCRRVARVRRGAVNHNGLDDLALTKPPRNRLLGGCESGANPRKIAVACKLH